ncbi:MAG: type IX secretion system membrane protein PorP/SprF [Bacteroidales bacterium]|nr:type IX secretion system membrane protein PorP/SprF [Bacteroidales bacterium]
MKAKIIFTFVMGLLSLGALAQQDAGFSMYFFNPVYINPGYAGSREAFSGTLVHRSQWVGMNDAPNTQSLSIHSPIGFSNVGLGLQAYNDNIGPMKNTGVNLTFAYHLPINETTKLSFGLTGMMNNIRIAWDEINFDDNNDQAFLGNTASNWVPDASFGLYLYKPRFYAGLSVNHLLQSRFGLSDSPGADLAKFYRQYYFTSGAVIPMSKTVDFRPSILVKYVESAPIVAQIDASFIFKQKLFVGAGFRTDKKINLKGMDNMLIGTIELEITRFLRIGYSYDYYLNRSGTYNSGTHEVMLGWDLYWTKTKMTSPRFF